MRLLFRCCLLRIANREEEEIYSTSYGLECLSMPRMYTSETLVRRRGYFAGFCCLWDFGAAAKASFMKPCRVRHNLLIP